MAATAELNERFSLPESDVGQTLLLELESILRIHHINPEELFYKWESYSMRMGTGVVLDPKTVRDFKKDLKENLEREMREKANISKGTEKRAVNATPRAAVAGADMFDLLTSNTPKSRVNGSASKRPGVFETPSTKSNKGHPMSSPLSQRIDNTPTQNFSDRKDAGSVIESLNSHIALPEPSEVAPLEARFKLKANTELAKFGYKTMAMKLSESSEILDDRIEEFVTIIQDHYKLEDGAFGNPASQNQNEIVAVGRIASDSPEGKLNASSIVLETSRRMGAGRRIPLKLDKLRDYDLFPGKIVALRGANASGEFFQPTEVLDVPSLSLVASSIDTIDSINDRLTGADGNSRPLITLVAAGPYTTETELDFSAFNALISAAQEMQADSLILSGPFIDSEHPLVRTGDFDLPPGYPVEPDRATLTDLFRAYIAQPLIKLAQALPTISIILCPSTRDAISRHVTWPQDKLVRKELGLPRQVQMVTNPMKISMNEIQFGISSLDVLGQIHSSEVVSGKYRQINILERMSRLVIEQRHFFPVFPPIISEKDESSEIPFTSLSPSLDVSYLKLGEMLGVLPDVLITPSVLPHFAKVIGGVLAINPGTLSKRRGPGTYARMIIEPLHITDEDRDKGEVVSHRLYDRCRVDIVKI